MNLSLRILLFISSLFISSHGYCNAPLPRHLPADVANNFCNLKVLYNGRICPLHTLAHDFTTKLTGKSSYRGLSAPQVFTGWIFYFTSWRSEKMIRLKGSAPSLILGIDGSDASLSDFFDASGEYVLNRYVGVDASIDSLSLKSALTDADRKGIADAHDKFSLFRMLYAGQLLKIFPLHNADNNVMWYSPVDNLPIDTDNEKWIFVKKSLDYAHELVATRDFNALNAMLLKIGKFQQAEAAEVMPSQFRCDVEKCYNRYHSSTLFFVIAMSAGLLFLVVTITCMARNRALPKFAHKIMIAGNIAALTYLSLVFAMRWIIGAHIPLSSGFDTLLFMAQLIAIASVSFHRRYTPLLPLGLLLCGMVMMAAHISEKNPQITPLMPVLNSPLLSIHVAVIMISYALFALIMLNSAVALTMHHFTRSCSDWLEKSALAGRIVLYPAVFLLTAGIFIGAVWANVSWGRYWGWDPKEVWALITMLIYATALHSRSLRCFNRPVFFHWFAMLAFLSVLFTYFGVNYFLGGLHSYGAA
ncbi:MAG: cytochrome c biogenesis protein [Muribaculaceae bacterium]